MIGVGQGTACACDPEGRQGIISGGNGIIGLELVWLALASHRSMVECQGAL